MKFDEDQINQHLAGATHWRREGDMVIRDFKFENFKSAIEFVNRVADEAESMDHHPDILIHGWNNVRLSIYSHDKGGLTARDFRLAAKIDQLS